MSALSSRALPVPGRGEQIVQEMVIALAPEEVPLVTEALELAKRIDCIPRSGLPGTSEDEDPQSSASADGSTRSRVALSHEEPIIDLIEGDRRSLRRIPDGSPGLDRPPVGAGPRTSGPADGS